MENVVLEHGYKGKKNNVLRGIKVLAVEGCKHFCGGKKPG